MPDSITELFFGSDGPPVFIRAPAAENPDWGYARNLQSVLMVPSAEWVQSVASFPFELNGKNFVAPNRDYPYEGLMVHQQGENWRFIDCIALGLELPNGEYLPFKIDSEQPSVYLNPWTVAYAYKAAWKDSKTGATRELRAFVTYYLCSVNTPDFVSGCIDFVFPDELIFDGQEVTPVIQPFLDVRHMFGSSNFYDYIVGHESSSNHITRIDVSSYNRKISFYLPPAETVLFHGFETLSWWHKLGTGERTEIPMGLGTQTAFKGERKESAAFFRLRVPRGDSKFTKFRLFFGCGIDGHTTQYQYNDLCKIYEQSRIHDRNQYQEIKRKFQCQGSVEQQQRLIARIVGLTKFKVYIPIQTGKDFALIPPAGVWWFKMPWYRDVFEGYLNSLDTLLQIDTEAQNIKEAVRLALSSVDPLTGRVPNKLPDFGHMDVSFTATDASLLCLLVGHLVVCRMPRPCTPDERQFAWDVHSATDRFIQQLKRIEQGDDPCIWVDGPPVLDNHTSLLLSVPWHSWIDSRQERREVCGMVFSMLPYRASPNFLEKVFSHLRDPAELGGYFASPCLFLPEINAQWITLLEAASETIKRLIKAEPIPSPIRYNLERSGDTIQNILNNALANYKRVFWNEAKGFLFNLVTHDQCIRDDRECESTITATALLGKRVFDEQELRRMLSSARKTLFVNRCSLGRKGKPTLFGVVTQNTPELVFYGDPQYHGQVVWLKSLPYLIRFLQLLDEETLIDEIIDNVLDHQTTESTVFYSNELLARPYGNNSTPNAYTSNNPVPVKNPIQFWSQFTDAIVARLCGCVGSDDNEI